MLQLEQQLQQQANPAVAAKERVLAKFRQLDFNLLGLDNWSDDLKGALEGALSAFTNCGMCNWCGQAGHESTCCWVGAQAYRNCESRKVNHGGQMVNAWTHFKRLRQY